MRKLIILGLLIPFFSFASIQVVHKFDDIKLSDGIIQVYQLKPMREIRQSDLIKQIVDGDLIAVSGDNKAVMIQYKNDYNVNFMLVYGESSSFIVIAIYDTLTRADYEAIKRMNRIVLEQNWKVN